MKNVLTVIIMLAVILAIGAFSLMGSYNSLVSADEAVTSAWAQAENVYQRRMDLIPNLVETVKGYAVHEQSTLQGVIEARSKITQMNVSPEIVNQPEKLRQFQAAQTELSSFLGRLLAVSERYPDLKANQNFLTLQTQLEGTENRIAVERMRFNETAQRFNTMIRVFPKNIVASFAGLSKKAYFQADQGAAQAPKVKF